MAREIQEPTRTRDGGPNEGDVFKHPAYALITAGRVQGAAVLYGSDFLHQQYIRIKISPSQLKRSLSDDSYYAPNVGYIEVDLSEAQWATFVSSLNVGMGVPCTVSYLHGKQVPGLPPPVDRTEQFGAEMAHRLKRAREKLGALESLIAASGLSKAKQGDLLSAVRSASMDIGSNAAFVADRFGEHMEQTMEAAKTEVNAYMMGAIQSAGLQALGAKPVLTLNYRDGGDGEQPIVEAAP